VPGKFKKHFIFPYNFIRFLNRPISFREAQDAIRGRLEQREKNFLRFVKQCIYDTRSSPYLPLLRRARWDYDDIVSETRSCGIEGVLKRLKDSGVWVSFEEFKGRKAICRGGERYQARDSDFDNPLISSGVRVSTGGTSGRPVKSNIYLDFLAARANYDRLMFEMLHIYDVPLILWYPGLPAVTGISNSLRYAKIGRPPERWFNLASSAKRMDSGWKNRLGTSAVVWLSRLSKAPLAVPEPLSLNDVNVVLEWIDRRKKRHGRCVVQCYVSQAVRICRGASARGMDLRGTLFIVGSEPLTRAKYQEIVGTNAEVFPRYHATEIGSIATGCGRPSEVGDLHLHVDTVAVLQGEDPTDGVGSFFFTSFINAAPKVMLNVEMGDSGVIRRMRCGCLFDQMGLHTHLLGVRSYSRTSSEGMSVCHSELSRLLEEELPSKYGGSLLDYQLVEVEDGNSMTRLLLRIDPGLGPVDEHSVVKDILTGLRRIDAIHRVHAEVWEQAGAIKVIRQRPESTVSGKSASIIGKDGVPFGR